MADLEKWINYGMGGAGINATYISNQFLLPDAHIEKEVVVGSAFEAIGRATSTRELVSSDEARSIRF
jgi:hypothetical protein